MGLLLRPQNDYSSNQYKLPNSIKLITFIQQLNDAYRTQWKEACPRQTHFECILLWRMQFIEMFSNFMGSRSQISITHGRTYITEKLLEWAIDRWTEQQNTNKITYIFIDGIIFHLFYVHSVNGNEKSRGIEKESAFCRLLCVCVSVSDARDYLIRCHI